jgi:hypothetical protein
MIFGKFVEASSVDVDSGCIWVGDPCYVIKDEGDDRPKDLGKNWSEMTTTFFNRSGYDACQEAFWDWDSDRSAALFESSEWSNWEEEYGDSLDRNVEGSVAREKKVAAMNAFNKAYEKKHPRPKRELDTNFANFTHDLGHGGMGTMLSTYHGDGSYPVLVQYKNGRIRKVLIDFDVRGPLSDRIIDFFMWKIPNFVKKRWKKLRPST